MDDLIDWARPAACREDGQDQAECGMPRAGRRKRPASVVADLIAFPTADQPMRDAIGLTVQLRIAERNIAVA